MPKTKTTPKPTPATYDLSLLERGTLASSLPQRARSTAEARAIRALRDRLGPSESDAEPLGLEWDPEARSLSIPSDVPPQTAGARFDAAVKRVRPFALASAEVELIRTGMRTIIASQEVPTTDDWLDLLDVFDPESDD